MKCLLINLDRSPARLAHMTAEFSRVGIAFDRVAAIDGLRCPDIAGMSPHLSLSEIGCFLSHQACWQIIAQGDDACGAIFEDDVIFTETAGLLLANQSWVPADADIVKMETVFRKAVVAMKQIPAGPGYALHRLYGFHWGSAGYVISKRAARDLLDATRNNDIPIDHVIFNQGSATCSSKVIYQLSPALCTQASYLREKAAEFPSEIEQTRHALLQERGLVKQCGRPPFTKFAIEARRIWRQLVDICRLRREKTIPFDYRGQRVRRSMA
ncbi:glycosyltransferase family 25 protein [Mesorhizobium sp. dw_380]|uniref:glycosyltransferase family 25 protein n=1 Tax=Mesorhizobium sp. dw_380 TaxID=2812001 RepID=UPI001BDDE921|nr:glycosyltransferase family 25 protein [Mesorhizobium sp. dw_380]